MIKHQKNTGLAELWAFNKFVGYARHWEDLEIFVEELKKLNPNTVDRKNYRIMIGNDCMKEWYRK